MADKFSHTPGPWHSHFHRVPRKGAGYWKIFDTDNNHPCVANCLDSHGNGKANARLISAAPDLLEACEAAAEHYKDTDAPTGFKLMAAIHKATDGESEVLGLLRNKSSK
jgi:hypothetical protein